MRKLPEFKNSPFFARCCDEKVSGTRSHFLTKHFSILSFTLLFMLPFNMSCKENKYAPKNDIETEYMSTTKVDSTIKNGKADSSNKGQGTARVSREKVIEYLKKLHLISDPMNYKIVLTNDELYIDSKRQPDDIHRHIMNNFVKNPTGHLEVSYIVSTD